MQNTYSYEQFQRLNEVLLSAKEELKNFDNQNSFANRCQLRRLINRLTDELCLRNSSPHIRRLYQNWNVLNERGCTKQDLLFIIETLTGIKKDLFADYYDKIFISHSEKDQEIACELIALLHNIGIKKPINGLNGQIFCSSYDGYLIPLRENNIEYIKTQLDSTDNVLALVLYSKNYMKSVACLNEAGAIWIKDIPFYPVILPDFSFEEIKGFLNPNITGFKIDDKYKLNEFKDNLVQYFNLQEVNANIWEQERDKFISKFDNKNLVS